MNDVPRESVKTWNIFQLGRAKQELLLRDGSFFFERGGGGGEVERFPKKKFLLNNNCWKEKSENGSHGEKIEQGLCNVKNKLLHTKKNEVWEQYFVPQKIA